MKSRGLTMSPQPFAKESRFVGVDDGNCVYYSVTGSRESLPLVLCDGLGCAGYVWKYLYRDFARKYLLLHWHYPGHGKSIAAEDGSSMTLDDLVRDLKAVMDHAGIQKACLIGHSMGVQVILEFHRQHPDRVLGLVPVCGSYGRPLETLWNTNLLKTVFPYLRRASSRHPLVSQWLWRRITSSMLTYQLAVHVDVNRHLVKREDFISCLLDASEVRFRHYVELLHSASLHSAEEHLANIDVPTLIVASEKDQFSPNWLSKKMHRTIPDSELLTMPTCSHAAPIELPDFMNLRLEKFLSTHFPGFDRPFRTQSGECAEKAARTDGHEHCSDAREWGADARVSSAKAREWSAETREWGTEAREWGTEAREWSGGIAPLRLSGRSELTGNPPGPALRMVPDPPIPPVAKPFDRSCGQPAVE